jgi:hypothetical protein
MKYLLYFLTHQKLTMLQLFNRPYCYETSTKRKVRAAVLFGVFVFVFLAFFQPFQLNTYRGSVALLALCYGAVTTCIMLLLNVLLPRIATGLFNEADWNVGREIFWTCANLLCIALANMLYTGWVGSMRFDLQSFLSIGLYTLAVGLFPLTGGILWNESRLRNKFSTGSERINKALTVAHHQHKKIKEDIKLVEIPSENAGESFTVHPKSLLFVKAAENYAEVYWLVEDTPKRTVVRANLRMFEDALLDLPEFNRCHKSYIVNLAVVHRISGNAQGYKLHLANISETIPVSRKLNNSIKNLLETYA